jgi:hypothetical protein
MSKKKSTVAIRQEGLDKFYTIPSIAKHCMDVVGNKYNWTQWDVIVEPSAGNGSFFKQIPVENKIGLDIAPEDPSILTQDFFDYTPSSDQKTILVLGNPPFGRVSSLAIKFFNHASKWATVIAFIIPRTFRRISVQNKLNPYFYLEHDEDIPMEPCSFEPAMSAKCCFQIWRKRETLRSLVELPATHDDWDFLPHGPKDEKGQPTPPTGADFAIRAYGGKCGDIVSENLSSLRPKSWHWIQSRIDTTVLMERFSKLDYSLSVNTARQNSIGRKELVKLYQDALQIGFDDSKGE